MLFEMLAWAQSAPSTGHAQTLFDQALTNPVVPIVLIFGVVLMCIFFGIFHLIPLFGDIVVDAHAVLAMAMGSMKRNGDNSMSAQPTTKPAAMMYTCTMHLEVISDKPGTCPKCGMALVPKK